MRGRTNEYSAEERASGAIRYDNYFNYSYAEACERYESVAKWYKSEAVFKAAKSKRKQSA